jgi:hypothetical protein
MEKNHHNESVGLEKLWNFIVDNLLIWNTFKVFKFEIQIL